MEISGNSRNSIVLNFLGNDDGHAKVMPQQSPTAICIVLDNDSLSGSCFEDDDDDDDDNNAFYSTLSQKKSSKECTFWKKAASEIRFIDDSARSSVASDCQVISQNLPEHSPSADKILALPSYNVRYRAASSDFLEVSQSRLSGNHYSSLTTLTLSDRQSSIASAESATESIQQERLPSRIERRHEAQSLDAMLDSQQTIPPGMALKSCLVEVDETGCKVSCSCLAEPRHLSFLQHNNCQQMPIRAAATENEVPLSNTNSLYCCVEKVDSGSSAPNDALDAQSQYSIYLEKDCRYYFQHPWSRLFIAYFVIFCNFLIFAEDPVSHSHTESEIPIVGNVFAFVMTKYPPEWEWQMIKISLWIAAIVTGMGIGKHVIHKLLLARLCRLKMFHEEQGSWMIMFLTVIVSLYIFSNVYNTFLLAAHPFACKYQISALMGITNSSVMKAAACGTWLGDFVTAWMVTDMMLQDSVYPAWAPHIRNFWRQGNTRIVTFWAGSIGMSALVVTLIVSDWINWDKLNRDFVATTELSRAFLASFILVMDLFIVMQDWDFPHFTSTLDINLPGMKIKAVKLNFCYCPLHIQEFWRIHITGKWFNYGIIFLVMILDLNMWKNQFFYVPEAYGQYIGPDYKIYTVSDYDILATGNSTIWTYEWRSTNIDRGTNKSLLERDMLMNSRYLIYTLEEKCTAFIPSVIGFFIFGLLIYLYGRFPPKDSENLGGRLKLRKRSYRSSWKRERGSFYNDESCPLPSANQVPPPPPPTIVKFGKDGSNNNNDASNIAPSASMQK